MAVTVQTIVAGPFTGTGAALSLPFTWKTFTPEEIEVFTLAAGVETIIAPNLYTVSINKDAFNQVLEGGSVLYAGASGAAIYLRAKPRMDQGQSWSDTGSRLRNLNEGLDRAALRDLRLKHDLEEGITGANGALAAAIVARDAAAGSASSAASAASSADADAASAAGALAEIQEIASGAPDAPSVFNKANKTGDNISAAAFRSALDTAQIPTSATYGTHQAAAVAALAGELPFFGAVDSTIALTCSDGRLDLFLRKIAGWPIGDQGRINITVPAGKYTFATGQRLSHPFGQRIQIAGAATVTPVFSSVVSVVSNGARDHDVTIQVVDGSALAVGDSVNLRGVTGTGECGLFWGSFVITAKPTANRFTFKHKAKGVAFNAYTVATMTIKKVSTAFEFLGSSGFTVHGRLGDGSSGAQTGGFRDIAIIGNNTGSFNGLVLDIGAEVVAQGEIGVTNFGGDNIYGLYNSVLYAVFLCSSNSGGSNLYFLSGGAAQGVSGGFTGGNVYGAYGAYGVALSFTNASCSGNLNGYGALVSSGAGNTMQIHGNTSGGVYVTSGYLDVTGSSILSVGGTFGIRVIGGGRVKATNATVLGHTTDLYVDAAGSVIEAVGATYSTSSVAPNTFGGNGGGAIVTSTTTLLGLVGSTATLTAADPKVDFVDGATVATVSGDGGHMGVFAASVNRHPKLGYMSGAAYVDKFTFASGASLDPVENSTVTLALTSDTILTIKAKGSDGTIRSGTIALT